jgi:glycerol-3-phosphate O-acyltransferase
VNAPVTLPLWFVVLAALLAAIGLVDRILGPSLRWVLRRRVEQVIDRLNARLRLRMHPFKMTRRAVLVDRLSYDPRILEVVEAHMKESGEPREAVMRRVRRYATEIVPSFNAYAYFRLGYTIARAAARALYRVRIGFADDAGLSRIDPSASVVFVMNHRSNMDYVLVSYLAAERTALSYAVGEWARIWPLQNLIRSMGAYFIRRDSRDPLYRRVLERYVQMATESGIVQAVFPEGGLTRDGALRAPRLGLLDYMLRAFDLHGTRDLVFVPVGINYDRVLEDRALLQDGSGEKPGMVSKSAAATRFAVRQAGLWLLGRWHRFGYACVNFGSPLSIREWMGRRGIDLRALAGEERKREVEAFGRELMEAVGRVVPVLPVSLVATVLLESEGAPVAALELHRRVQALMRGLERADAHVYVPRTDEEYATAVGLRMLTLRRLVVERDGGFVPAAGEQPVLRYYANSIRHLARAPDEAAGAPQPSAPAT